MEKSIFVLLLIVLVVDLTTCEVVDVCTQRDGELSYDGNQKEDGNQQVTINRNFTGNGCKNDHGTLIIRLLEMNLKVNHGCADDHSLVLKIGNSPAEDICKLTKGDCFIMQEAYYPCADLSVLEHCVILQWRIREFIYPVNVAFVTHIFDSRYSFNINYTYIPCEDVTSKTVASTSTTTTTTQATIVNFFNTTRPTTQPSPHPTSQPIVDNVNTLTLVLGVFLGIAMIVIVGLALRLKTLTNANRQPQHPIALNNPLPGENKVDEPPNPMLGVTIHNYEHIQPPFLDEAQLNEVPRPTGVVEEDSEGYVVSNVFQLGESARGGEYAEAFQHMKPEPDYIEPETVRKEPDYIEPEAVRKEPPQEACDPLSTDSDGYIAFGKEN